MNENKPKITVLIPTFNRSQYLAQCLESIFVQTLPAVQIIVVNDGSTDDTKSLCARYRDQVEYYEISQQGRPGAMNFGLKKTTGDYVWIFDDDDVALPDALERLVAPLEGYPEYGFSYSTFNYTEEDEKTRRMGPVLHELKIPDVEERGFLIPLLEWNFLGGAGLFARTSCYKAVGDFHPELLRSADYEMAVRLARRFKGVFVPGGPTFHYRQHTGLRGPSHDRFSSSLLIEKWFNYNQKFFREFYKEFPLSDYLYPGDTLPACTRQAILQRLAIMANKLLFDEVKNDLHQLARLEDASPVTPKEYGIIRDMVVRDPSHGLGKIYDQYEFFQEIGRLSGASAVIRRLRPEILRAVCARWRQSKNAFEIFGVLKRFLFLWNIGC